MGRSFTPAGGASTPFEGQELLSAFVCTPLQASVNDYRVAQRAFDNASLLAISATTAINLTGLQGATPYRELLIVNTGANAITLKDASGASQAPNQFHFGADVILNQNQGVKLIALAAGGWGAEGGAGGGTPGAQFSGANYAFAAAQSAPDSTFYPVVLNAPQYDVGGYFAAGNPSRLTAPAAGVYLLTASLPWAATAALQFGAGILFRKNGVAGTYYGFNDIGGDVTATNSASNALSFPIQLAAADYMELVALQTSGGPLAIRTDLGVLGHFSMTQLH